jgi:hypothetical protein
MMVIIESIVNLYSPHPEVPLFPLKMIAEAAKKIFLVLKSFDFDIKQLEVQVKSPMDYGSEFRKGDILCPVLQNHLIWPRLKNLLKLGSQWPTLPISKDDRIANLYKALSFGNHKGTSSKLELLLKLALGKVIYGYILPLPLSKIT